MRLFSSIPLEHWHIAPNGVFSPNRWLSPSEIRAIFPNYFDATSGHLPLDLMVRIALKLQGTYSPPCSSLEVMSGSGETAIILKMAFPHLYIVPLWGDDEATRYEENGNLNLFLRCFFKNIPNYIRK